jgi:hypothetical protein
MLRIEDFDFSNMDLIFHLISVAKVCEIFETTDSTIQAMSEHFRIYQSGRGILAFWRNVPPSHLSLSKPDKQLGWLHFQT